MRALAKPALVRYK